MKKIFTVCGLPNSGRETFIKFVQENSARTHYINYNTFTEKIVEQMTRLCETKLQTRDLEKIKLVIRNNGLVTNAAIKYIKQVDADNTIFFIKLVNPNDILKIRRAFPSKVTTIVLDGHHDAMHAAVPIKLHNAIIMYNYDITIYNDNTIEGLKVRTSNFINMHMPSRVSYSNPFIKFFKK